MGNAISNLALSLSRFDSFEFYYISFKLANLFFFNTINLKLSHYPQFVKKKKGTGVKIYCEIWKNLKRNIRRWSFKRKWVYSALESKDLREENTGLQYWWDLQELFDALFAIFWASYFFYAIRYYESNSRVAWSDKLCLSISAKIIIYQYIQNKYVQMSKL